jgi:hypothetical protein
MRIEDNDRIRNRYTPIDPNDKTLLNADNVMLIFDKLVNGQYRFKCKILTYDEIVNLPDKEEGEIFYASDLKQFLGWNGTDLVVLG